jgi:hypothetical protein
VVWPLFDGDVVLETGERANRDGSATWERVACDGRFVRVSEHRHRVIVEILEPPVELGTAWVERHLGPPRERFVRGAIWDRPWGYVYAPVPPASSTERDHVEFRCCGCGEITELPYGTGVLEAFDDRGAAICEHCDSASWVQVGSFTEYYRFSRRDDVCEVGKHPAPDVRRYDLVRTPSPEELASARRAGQVVAVGLSIKVCPAHAGVLRDGFLGFKLAD